MNPYKTYQAQSFVGWTRIDVLLALYDGAIERLEQASEALTRNDALGAAPLLLRAQRIVVELLDGVDMGYGDLSQNLQRLYVFVLQSIGAGTASQITGAIQVLRTLREALLGIRIEAVALERTGAIPTADVGRQLLQAIG